MENFMTRLLENTCGEANPVLRLFDELNVLPGSQVSVAGISEISDEPETIAIAKMGKMEDESPIHEETQENNADFSSLSPGTSGLDPLQTLFLAEPQFFRTTLHDIGNSHGLFTSEYETREKAIPETDEHECHDDCTPTSGPDFLMEIQNPNWETAAFNRMISTFDELSRSASIESGDLLHSLSTNFVESLKTDGSKYICQSDTPTEKNGEEALTIAKRLMDQGKVVEAVPYVEYSLRDGQASLESWTLLALSQYLSQNDAQSIAACKEYLKFQTHDSASGRNLILLLMATCQSNEGDLLASRTAIFQWAVGYLGLNDVSVRNYLQEAKGAYTGGERTFAFVLIGILENCSKSMGMDLDGSLNWALAILYFSMDDFSRAGRCFERVLAHNPRSPSVINQISACLHNMHQFDQALSLQNQALEILDGFPRALYNKAMTLHAIGQTSEALGLIESALDRQHNSSQSADQFWYLAGRLAPRLPATLPEQYRARTRLMSSVISRDFNLFKENLDCFCKEGEFTNEATANQ